ncbi:MAG: phosphatidate cytidylyltransferase [Sedimentisphaerales bacterium]|nr:phosphatidate cytidylyltransferase [Sedimentisphaerales bacterium]
MLIGLFGAVLAVEGRLSLCNYFLTGRDYTALGFALLAGLFAVLAGWELARLARNKGYVLSVPVLAVGLVILILHPIWARSGRSADLAANAPEGLWLVFALQCSLFLFALLHALRRGASQAIGSLGVYCFGLLYLGLGGWFLVQIRLLGALAGDTWGQIRYLIIFLITVKSCDIGAYFTGRFFGRHLWVPSISPKKTWEGLVGGILLAVITASLFAHFSAIMNRFEAVLFGLVVAVTGQLGDLLESMLKRDAEQKDSARLIPEFGGVLDLLDSVLGAVPFAYLTVMLFS